MNVTLIDDEMYQNIHSFVWGCCLTAENKEFTVHKEERTLEHQLVINTICLDETSTDEMHIVEIEGVSLNGGLLPALLAVLRPPHTIMISLSGCELDLPVILRLRCGSGPLHLCGRNIVRIPRSDCYGTGNGTGIENENQYEEPVVAASTGKAECNEKGDEEGEKEGEKEGEESATVEEKEDEHQDDSHVASPKLLGRRNKSSIKRTRSKKDK
uniref:nucleoplasmin-like n=1 Tax=Myxine glutinosa TaxID=7769 RepID=UPI00358E4D42